MTIPNLIQKQQEKQTVVKLQKVYSTLSNAYTLAVQENGTPDYWDLRAMNDKTGLANFNKIMTKHLSVQKNCGLNPGCRYSGKYKDLNGVDTVTTGDTYSGSSRIILSDGTSVAFRQWMADCNWDWGSGLLKNTCGTISVDINGAKGPNKLGFDFFGFILTKNGIVPNGSATQTAYPFVDFCNLSKASVASYQNGSSCAAWVIYNGNMDYLHCSGLSWTGKKKCD